MKAPVAKEMSNQAFTSESKKGTAPSAKARRSASRVPKPSAQPHLSETDLYAPVRDLLLAQGYTVRAEVNGCDLVAVRDEHMVIVELKTAFNTALLIQAADRQRIADEVYIAIPRPDKSLRSARWEGILHLLRRLELGLIFVRLPQTRNRSVAQAEIALLPEPYIGKRQTRVRKKILRETVHRSADYNVGGSTRTPLITAYRERAVHIACCLAHFG
ncbi:MAG: DUF2161 family putative PD-(D/E)XK-type phosphodiesterase, partial [Firmicutes bacterium]|nr:DUF2161 family putative PD-(D/E)XK-type phosphodiesterase [Bacillota bacterium]